MISTLVGYQGTISKTRTNKSDDTTCGQLHEFVRDEDFLEVCDNYLKKISSFVDIDEEQKAFQGIQHHKEGRLIWGQIESGNYGYGATLKHRKKKSTKKRTVDDVELLPYLYMIYVPSGYDKCIMVLQKYGNMGIKGILTKAITDKFKEDYREDNLKLDFSPYLDMKVLYDYVKNGKMKSVRFIRYDLPKDIADQVLDPETQEKEGIMELRFERFNEELLKKILGKEVCKALAEGKTVKKGKVKLNIPFDYDEMKVEIEQDTLCRKRRKIFDLINQDGFIETIEIAPNEPGVKIVNGLPTYETICKKALAYINELCENLNMPVPEKPVAFNPKADS